VKKFLPPTLILHSTLIFLATLSFHLAQAADGAAAPQRPNILFILVDDLGWSDVGYQNPEIKVTPNLDRLSKQGIQFSNAYAATVCSPSRAEILTGRSPARLKMTSHIPGMGFEKYYEYSKRQSRKSRFWEAEIRDHLPLEEVTIAEALQANGYTTGFFGKWHLAGAGGEENNQANGCIDPEWHPQHQGFDLNIGGCAYGKPSGKGYFSPYNNCELKDGPKGEYLTNRLTDEAIAFMRANKDAPFFAYLSYYTIHSPLLPDPQVAKAIPNRYMAMVKSMDNGIGKILSALEEMDLAEETLLIFTSDNGGTRDQSPLRGKKGNLYEGGIRVPLIYRWPAKLEGGRVIDTPVAAADFFPTILAAVDAKAPASTKKLDGISYWAAITGEGDYTPHPIYQHFPHNRGGGGFDGASTVRDGDWKLHWKQESNDYALYHLKEDLGEENDLAKNHPEKVETLKQRLYEWLEATNANMPRLR